MILFGDLENFTSSGHLIRLGCVNVSQVHLGVGISPCRLEHDIFLNMELFSYCCRVDWALEGYTTV